MRRDWARFLATFWQAIAGGLLVGLGFAAIFLAWFGAAGNAILQTQVTYLVSGGLGGLAMVVLGGLLLVAFQVARHNALLASLLSEAPPGEQTQPVEAGDVVVVPLGAKTYHRPDCVWARGKQVTAYAPGERELRGLEPCRVCDPQAAS